jgi:hypothetical protein
MEVIKKMDRSTPAVSGNFPKVVIALGNYNKNVLTFREVVGLAGSIPT